MSSSLQTSGRIYFEQPIENMNSYSSRDVQSIQASDINALFEISQNKPSKTKEAIKCQ